MKTSATNWSSTSASPTSPAARFRSRARRKTRRRRRTSSSPTTWSSIASSPARAGPDLVGCKLRHRRAPALFLTLERNRQWWTREPLLGSGVRVSIPGSRLVWEYYAGQGIEIQWLGTFGKANGYYLSGHENANLRQLLDEALPLAARRAGGIAWEYLFSFDGGSPPWTSGLSQGTALQVFARAWSRFKEPAYLTAAEQALGVFRSPPPQGVRVRRGAGAHYAEYSYAPG